LYAQKGASSSGLQKPPTMISLQLSCHHRQSARPLGRRHRLSIPRSGVRFLERLNERSQLIAMRDMGALSQFHRMEKVARDLCSFGISATSVLQPADNLALLDNVLLARDDVALPPIR